MKKIIFITYLLTSVSSYSQWTYNSGENDFDGNYKTSSVYGTGGEFPYTKPYLVVNKFENSSVNIYISDAGYSGCEGRKVFFKFKGDEVIYETSYVENGTNNDSWFISSFKNITEYDFIFKLQTHSLLGVRLKSNCGSVDYKFSLGGATKAINFVLGKKWVEDKKKEILELKALKEKKLKEYRVNNSLFINRLEKKRKEIKVKDSLLKAKNNKKNKD